MDAKKRFVLDTNVLLHDPRAFYKFADNEVVVPITVIEEIDKFKRDQSEIGRNARTVSRYIDELRKIDHLAKGVPLEGGGTLRVVLGTGEGFRSPFTLASADDRVLAVALELQAQNGRSVVLVTKDANLRIKADAYGVDARDYDDPKLSVDHLYTGIVEIELGEEAIARFYHDGRIEAPVGLELYANQYLQMRGGGSSALGRFDLGLGRIVPLLRPKKGVWGIQPRNREQTFALDLLLNDQIKLATLIGKAGTGKTLLAIAAGLLKTADEGVYRRLLVSRPIFPLGRDIGFLPGELDDKLRPWMQPIFDNLELILGGKDPNVPEERQAGHSYEYLFEKGMLAVEPLVYIRGRSIPNQFLIVDEAQNLTPHEVKTIVTRAGEETKVILTGDPHQIDHPYLDASHNGLVHLVERFKEDALAGHVTLLKGERSALAERAANLL
jgi:PhoH-like ATPase